MRRKETSSACFIFKSTCGERENIQVERGYGGLLFVSVMGISREDFLKLAKWYGYDVKPRREKTR